MIPKWPCSVGTQQGHQATQPLQSRTCRTYHEENPCCSRKMICKWWLLQDLCEFTIGSKPSTPSTMRAFALWKNMESVPWYLSWLTKQWEKNTYIHSAPIGSSKLPFYCFVQKMWTLRRGVSSLKSIGQPWFLGSMPSNSSLLPWVGHCWRIRRVGRPARNSSDVSRFGEQWSVGHIQSAARNFWLNPHM